MDSDIPVRDAAVKASRNVPLRRRRKAKPQQDQAGGTLRDYHNLPEYLKDNEFITKYYRVNMPFKQTLWSLFGIHNETGNVWTHLLGFVLFVCLTVYVVTKPPMPLAFGHGQIEHLWLSVRDNVQSMAGDLKHNLHSLQQRLPHLQDVAHGLHAPSLHALQDNLHQLQENLQHRVDTLVHEVQEEAHHVAQVLRDTVHHLGDNIHDRWHAAREGVNSLLREALSGVLTWPVPRWPVYVFMAGAMICLLLSSVCHLFGCCSQHVSQMIWRFDYAGIAILIVASFFPPVYYCFLCQPLWQYFYLISTGCFGLGAVVVSLFEVFQQRQWRTFRATIFTCLGGWGVVPLVHGALLHRDVAAVRSAVVYDSIMGVLYVLGAVVYAQRIPERWMPGKFDVWFHGHQIFHVLIVVAALSHYQAVMLLLHWRDASGGCAVPVTAASDMSALLGRMRELGHELLAIDQVWDSLRHYAADHLGLAMAPAPTAAVPVGFGPA